MHFIKTEPDDDGKFTNTVVNSITCDVFIDKYLSNLNSNQIFSIKKEMYPLPSLYLCPDTDIVNLSSQIYGKT